MFPVFQVHDKKLAEYFIIFDNQDIGHSPTVNKKFMNLDNNALSHWIEQLFHTMYI